jgi:hypothetical protein
MTERVIMVHAKSLPLQRAPLLGTLGYKKALGWTALFLRAQLGNLEWAYLLGLSEIAKRGSGGEASLSMGAL